MEAVKNNMPGTAFIHVQEIPNIRCRMKFSPVSFRIHLDDLVSDSKSDVEIEINVFEVMHRDIRYHIEHHCLLNATLFRILKTSTKEHCVLLQLIMKLIV